MKFLLIFSIALACVGISSQHPQYDGCDETHPVFADKYFFYSIRFKCVQVKCVDSKEYAVLACAEEHCPPGKEIGRKNTTAIENFQYPDCCGGPICAD